MENSQLLEYIGETKTQKLIQSITKEYFEIKNKKTKNDLNSNCLISVVDEKEIKAIGMSCVNDLLNNNFAKFIEGAFMRGGTETLKSISNVDEDVRFTSASATRYNNNQTSQTTPIGSRVQVGSHCSCPT